KKPMRDGLGACIGGRELLDEFYGVFSENMRDLGSPPHSRKWFFEVLKAYGNNAHIGVVRMPDKRPAAAGIILCHSNGVTIPWASSLRRYNRWNPNMLLYWQFLSFSADMGFPHFDFGRSTPGEGTYRFKAQWGARPEPLHWARLAVGNEICIKSSGNPERNGAGPNPLRDTASRSIARLPISILKGVGSLTRKYISL
ncbi:MAG: GNAT family N-acetyltransferase, partial [Desulfobacterales bacterium]|nr:GNAT family N-acetyltransferase [Desulfobacterales bacterium]